MGSWALCQEALRLWKWLNRQGISLIMHHVMGSLNSREDKLSWQRLVDQKWQLHTELSQDVFLQWGEPWLNRFITAENVMSALLHVGVSKKLSLGDAFCVEWSKGLLLYAFPRLPYLARVLRKVKNDLAPVILVAPD